MGSRSLLNIDIHPDVRRRFKEICDREGETMSRKLRKWIYMYINEHEVGNPQLMLHPTREPSLLSQVLEERTGEFPMNVRRRRATVQLGKMLNKYPHKSKSEIVQLFALKYGFSVEKAREYARLLDRARTKST